MRRAAFALLIAASARAQASAPAPSPAAPTTPPAAPAAPAAPGAMPPGQDAREVYRAGEEAYGREDFRGAIVYFAKAFELSGKPEILFNLALCHRNLGEYDRAIAYYEKYLELRPEAADRPEVERNIANLTVLQTQKQPPAAVEPAPAPAAAVATAPPPPPPEPERPFYKKWWFWTGVGVAVAAGVAIFFVTRPEEPAYPTGTDPSRDF